MRSFILILVWMFSLPVQAFEAPESRPLRERPFVGTVLPEAQVQPFSQVDTLLYVGPGVWDTGREHLKLYLKERNRHYATLAPEQLLAGELSRTSARTLVMPGGESWTYLDTLQDSGAQAIREFVARGGNYFGICAGAFYATSHRDGGAATGAYGIGLLQGTAYDGTAHGIAPFKEGMLDFRVLISGLKSMYRIVLFGGPSFRYSEEEARAKKIEVLARFEGSQEPAMIFFQYGQGKVFLSAPHLEVEENLMDWGEEFEDPESDWPILDAIYQKMLPSLR